MELTTEIHPIKRLFGIKQLQAVFALVGLFCAVVIFLLENRPDYIGMVLLPIVFSLVSVFYNYDKYIIGPGSLLIYVFYFARFTVFPMIIVFGDYFCDIPSEIYSLYLNEACLFMAVEMLAVYIVMAFVNPRLMKRDLRVFSKNEAFKSSGIERLCNNKVLYLVIAAFLLFDLAMYVLYPNLFPLYWEFIFTRGDQIVRLERLHELIDSMPGGIYYIFKLTAEFSKIAIVMIALVKINNAEKLKNPLKWLLSLFLMFLAFTILSSEQINVVLLCLAIFYYMTVKYISYNRSIIIAALAFAFIGFIFVMKRIANVEDMQGFARIINNYFDGPMNIAAGLYYKSVGNVGFANLFSDFISQLPIVGELASYPATNVSWNDFYDTGGAILPMLCCGYIYFGAVGIGLPAMLVALTAVWFDSLIQNAENEEYKCIFTYMAIHLGITIGMYNVIIYYSLWVYEYFLPLVLFAVDKYLYRNVRRKKVFGTIYRRTPYSERIVKMRTVKTNG